MATVAKRNRQKRKLGELAVLDGQTTQNDRTVLLDKIYQKVKAKHCFLYWLKLI